MSHKNPVYLYVTPFFPSPKTWQGGFCLDAVRAVRKDGRYEVVVMTTTDYGGDYEFDGFKVCQFPRKQIGASEYFESFWVGKNNRFFLEKLKKIGIAPQEVAVCHVHDFIHYVQYALALKELNPKCLALVHHHYAGYYTLEIGKLGVVPVWSDLFYRKIRREFEAVDAHVFISEHCRRQYGRVIDFDTGERQGELKDQLILGRWYRSIGMEDSYVLYNPVDKERFCRESGAPGVRSLPNPHRPFVIGNVGNFNPCKCQMDLIRAFEIVLGELPTAKLKLVGDGLKCFEDCKRYVREYGLGDAVEFVPPMAHDALPDFYRGLDLFVMTSVNEGFGCVNAEANACGVPVMAVRGLPFEEVLPAADRERWTFAAHDVEGLARKIVDFAYQPREQRLGVSLDADELIPKFLDWTERKRHG